MEPDKKEKRFVGPITTASVLSLLSIGALEIFKTAVGFFAYLAIKKGWDKYWAKRKGGNE